MDKILWLSLIVIKANAFNLDLNHAIIFEDPMSPPIENYFGFSVVLTDKTKGHDKGIFIGSPKQSYFSKIKSGAMYTCNFKEGCSLLDLPPNNKKILFKNAFIGGNADINNNKNLLIISAHKAFLGLGPSNWPKGYLFLRNLTSNKTTLLDPFSDESPTKKTVYTYGQCQAGFSVQFVKNKSDNLIMGGPECFLKGSSLNYKILPKKVINHIHKQGFLYGYSVSSGNFYNKKLIKYIKSSPFEREVAIFSEPPRSGYIGRYNPIIQEIKSPNTGDGFGYCIATGDINGDQLDDIVVGAPFYKISTFNEGSVYVYLGNSKKMQPPAIGHVITGKHRNGHFGMAIMYLNDINADGFGDVAVAAPFQGSGVVYIYHGTSKGLNPTPAQIIDSQNVYSNLKGFGFSFSKPCDVFNKNVSDLAIGSFLSGHAVVLRGRPVMVVTTSLLSIPRILQKNDTKFIVQATYSVENKHNSNHYPYNITLKRTIEIDPEFKRTSLSPPTDITKDIIVTIGTTFVENITVHLNNHRTEPVPINLTYVYVDKQQTESNTIFLTKTTSNYSSDTFEPTSPILDKKRSTDTHISVPFNLNCGDDKICQSNLTLQLRFPNLYNNTYLVGTDKKVSLEVDIHNFGEHAYTNELIVTLPEKIRLKNELCTVVKNETKIIKCPISNIDKNEQVIFNLDIKEALDEYFTGLLPISVELRTQSENKGNLTNKIVLNIARDADIHLDGVSGQNAYELGKNGLTNFTQTYRVIKEGSSPIGEVKVTFQFPAYISPNLEGTIGFLNVWHPKNCTGSEETDSEIAPNDFDIDNRRKRDTDFQNDGLHKLKEMNASRNIEISQSLVNLNIFREIVIICTVGPFKDYVNEETINFTMQLNQSKLFGELGNKKQIVYKSFGEAKIMSFDDESETRSNYTLSTTFVDELKVSHFSFWYILAAIILGILLLLLLVIVLVRAGFFKRTTKEKLEKIKENNLTPESIDGSIDDLLSNDNVFTPLDEPLEEVNLTPDTSEKIITVASDSANPDVLI